MSTQAIALESSGSRTQQVVETVLFTAAGVGTLFLLGKVIAAATAGMPYGCWQTTAARAGASALVVGSLATFRKGNLALFGAAYALVLLASHWSPLLLTSAVLAGVAAFGVDRLLSKSDAFVRVLSVTLVFNLLLTLSSFVKAFSSTNGRTGLGEYTSATGLRIASTLIIGVAILIVARLVRNTRQTAR